MDETTPSGETPGEGPDPRTPPPGSFDSQRHLAREIAADAVRRLPGDARGDVEEEVDRAIRATSTRMEATLAEVRLAAIAIGLVCVVAAMVASGVAPAWGIPLLAVLGAWGAAGVGILALLRRRGHERLMRRLVSVVDAIGFGSVFLLLSGEGAGASTAVVAAAGAAAVLLAFLGPVRLSRSAALVSAISALALWTFVGVVGGVAAGPLAGVAAIVLAGSYLGSRLTGGVRRLIQEQAVSHHLDTLYRHSQEAVEAREHILGIVSHDLRNPLSTIAATAGLLLEVPLDEEARGGHLRVIERVTAHMNRLIQDLLDVSRIEAGTLTVVLAPCEVEELLRAAEEVMRPVAEENGVRLEVRVDDGLPRVFADAERIRQVLSNLVGNAVKFSSEGSRVSVEARPFPGGVRVAVVDQGPGISAEERENLWKKLWQATPGDRRGLGLGLTIARSIIAAHDERIGVDSEVGQGSEFWFTLSDAEVD